MTTYEILDGLEFCCFFFQAEDGIRDIGVTGVQTCALPISPDPNGQMALPPQPFVEEPFDRWGQAGAVVGVANLFDGLRLSRIRIDGPGDRPQAQTADHCQAELGNQVSRVGGDDRGSEYLVPPRPEEHLDEPFVLAIEDGSVHLTELLREG